MVVLVSNHSNEFVAAYERWLAARADLAASTGSAAAAAADVGGAGGVGAAKLDHFTPQGDVGDRQKRSFLGLAMLIESGLVAMGEVDLLSFHCPFTALHCPFAAFHCPFADFHCPFAVFHCLSLSFHCLSLSFCCRSLPFTGHRAGRDGVQADPQARRLHPHTQRRTAIHTRADTIRRAREPGLPAACGVRRLDP